MREGFKERSMDRRACKKTDDTIHRRPVRERRCARAYGSSPPAGSRRAPKSKMLAYHHQDEDPGRKARALHRAPSPHVCRSQTLQSKSATPFHP